MLERVPNPENDNRLAHRQICQLCGEVCRVDFTVSHEHWQLGMPRDLWNTHICLNCYTKQADERLVPWCESIKLYPESLLKQLNNMIEWGQLITKEK